MGRMRWVKLWTQETLYGTTNRELTLEERAIWFELLALAGDSPIPGIICISPNVSFTNAQLAQILGAPEDLVSLTLVKLSSPEIDKISLNGTGLITIINFQRYQESFDKTEYQRIYMKAYRERKSNISETNESETNQQKGREGRGGEEEEKRKDNIKEPPIIPLKKGAATIKVIRDILNDPDELLKLQRLYSISEHDLLLEIEHCASWWDGELKKYPRRRHRPLAALHNWLKKRKGGENVRPAIIKGELGPWRVVDGGAEAKEVN